MAEAERIVNHLYVHVPFCAHRCGYCDFVTTSASPELHDRYIAALQQEWKLRSNEIGAAPARFETIFIGGGTPTLLQPAALEELLEWFSTLAAPECELTIECNPETVDEALAARLVNGGVSRVSLGVQSMTQSTLETLERRANPETIRNAIACLRSAGIKNLSTDLIWAVPGQTREQLENDLTEIVELAPNHISAYELEFKPGTRMTHAWGGAEQAVGDDADDMYDTVVDVLGAAGYDWYETANFARDGKVSRHNLGYWTQADYMGIGIGAVGTIDASRRVNLPNLPKYLGALESGELPPARIESIDSDNKRRERILLALRLARPCTITSDDFATVVDRSAVDDLATHGLFETASPADGELEISLTRRGRMLLNGVLARILTLES